MENMLTTLGQEIAGLTQKNENVDITTNREEHNKYQDMVSKDLVKDVEFALSLKDNQIDNAKLQTKVNSIEEYLAIQKANSEFSSLDKEAGDNFAPLIPLIPYIVGGVVGGSANAYTQYKRNGDNLTLDNTNWIELGVNTITGVYSGGASSIGGAIVRGGIASGANETYNQTVNVTNNSLDEKVKEVVKASAIGGFTGYGIGKAGLLGNQIIIKNNQIGKPFTTGAKTLKLPAETAAGIAGAVAPQIVNNKDNSND